MFSVQDDAALLPYFLKSNSLYFFGAIRPLARKPRMMPASNAIKRIVASPPFNTHLAKPSTGVPS